MTNQSADIGASGVTSIMGGERYRPYLAYKDSGVEWLGEIPTHWEVARADSLFRYEKIQIEPSTISEQSIFHYSIPAIQETGNGVFESPADIDSAKLQVFGHRLLVSKLNPRKGVVLVADEKPVPTICSTEFVPLEIRSCDLEWAFYLYSSEPTRQRLSAVVRSATRSHQRAEVAEVLKMWHGVPPHSEQRAIAAFLDRETAQIDALVAKKERLIELLQEKRTALISDAVTKGLDPDVPLKDSGVEWLGEIPVHWEIMRLKQASRIQGGFAFSTDSFRNEGIPVVRMNNIRRGVLDLDNVVRIPEHQCKDAFALNEGDIIYGLSGSIGATGSLGNYAVVRKGDTPAQLNQRVAQFRPMIDRITEKFLVGSLQTSVFYEQVLSYTTGTAQFNVSTNDIGNVVLALPPIKEQRAIAAFLDSETAPINALMARVREAIDRFKELRTALISAAVTGKIDVREAAT